MESGSAVGEGSTPPDRVEVSTVLTGEASSARVLPAAPALTSVSLGVSRAGVVEVVEVHSDVLSSLTVQGRRLSALVGPTDRRQLVGLFLSTTAAGAGRVIVTMDLGAGPQPVAITAEDHTSDLRLYVLRVF